MGQLFKNNATSVLASAATNVATTLTLKAGEGARFPAISGGNHFWLTLIGRDANGIENEWEIVKVTARSADALTVVRGQDNTTAVAWGVGTPVALRLNAVTMEALEPLAAVGTTAQYWRGDKSWRDFATDVRASALTGLVTTDGTVVVATDSILAATGKLQKQITDLDGAKQELIAAGTTAQYYRGDKAWRDLNTDVRAATLTGLSLATGTAITATDTVLTAAGKLQKQITDLDTAKQDSITAGTTSQFYRGDKTWQDLFTQVRAATLTGLSTATNAAIAAADTALVAFGKLQAQVSHLDSTKVETTAIIDAAHGGTGQSAYTVGDLLYASTASALSKIAAVTTGNALISGGVGAAPTWGKIGLTTHITGVLPIANGGTNSNATPTDGGLAYGDGTKIAFTAAGTSGQFMKSAGTGVPVWASLSLSDLSGAWTKKAVRVATTANLTVTYSSNTLTNTGTLAALAIDGITLAVGDRVLVKNQTSAAQNGIFEVTNAGSASVAWVLTRTSDANSSAEVAGATVSVDEGTSNVGDLWTTTFKPTDTLNSTAMNWYEILTSANYGTWAPSKTGSGASGTWAIAITGNAATATTLATARTINGVSFNGSANITITANTTNTLTRGSYLTGSNFNGSAATTWAVDADDAATANKIAARDASGDLFARYFVGTYVSSSHSVATRNSDTAFFSTTDNYIRKNTAAGFRTSLDVYSKGETEGLLGWRNRIINGDMRIDQRNSGASVSCPASATTYIVDRFAWLGVGCAATAQRVADAPTGFTHSLKITVSTAKATMASGDFALLQQPIEGSNIADFNWGSSSAVDVTLTFWVKSNKTGNFIASLRGNGRSYAVPYTISTAGTWEKKTATIPGDVTGTWATDNTTGVTLFFSMGTGSAQNLASTGTWLGVNGTSHSSQVNVMAAVGNYFQITGVQLEAGTVATPFDFRPPTIEEALCKRYFQKVTCINDTTASQAVMLPVQMRSGTGTVTRTGGSGTGGTMALYSDGSGLYQETNNTLVALVSYTISTEL